MCGGRGRCLLETGNAGSNKPKSQWKAKVQRSTLHQPVRTSNNADRGGYRYVNWLIRGSTAWQLHPMHHHGFSTILLWLLGRNRVAALSHPTVTLAKRVSTSMANSTFIFVSFRLGNHSTWTSSNRSSFLTTAACCVDRSRERDQILSCPT